MVEDKGSSFVVDWKTNYFGRCDEYIRDINEFRSEDRDLSAEHVEEEKCAGQKSGREMRYYRVKKQAG